MAKRTKIELGTPTEDLPEWSVALDFVEEEKEEEVPAVTSQEQTATTTVRSTVAGGGSSALNSGFAAEFVLDGAISTPKQTTSGEFNDDFDMFGNSNEIIGGDFGSRIPTSNGVAANITITDNSDAILGDGISNIGANENTDGLLGGTPSSVGANENTNVLLGGAEATSIPMAGEMNAGVSSVAVEGEKVTSTPVVEVETPSVPTVEATIASPVMASEQNEEPAIQIIEDIPFDNSPVVTAPVVEPSVVETPVAEVPVAETPVAEVPVVETPMAEVPVMTAPVVEVPVVETPVAEVPVAEELVVTTPVVEVPVVETPVVEVPVAEVPVAEEPVVTTPVVEVPVVETPVVEVPQVVEPIGAFHSDIEEAITIPEESSVEQTIQSVEQILSENFVNKTSESSEDVDEVEERLTDLVNSMEDWEHSENALSEAATMLSNEEKALKDKEMKLTEDEKLQNLLDRLDISEGLSRMSATAQEDMADVIEQTEKNNDLEMEEPVEENTEEPVMEVEIPVEEPVEGNTEEPVMEVEIPVEEPVEENTEEPVMEVEIPVEEPVEGNTEEPVMEVAKQVENEASHSSFLSDFEISNDMFDMGYDYSDEPDYSDENIDLSAFRGSIKDAEEINAQLDKDIDVNVQDENNEKPDFDMSNLVAAALNDLSKRSSEESLEDDEESEENAPVLDLSETDSEDDEESEESAPVLDLSETDSEDDSNLDAAEELHAGEEVQSEAVLEEKKDLVAGEEVVPESTIEIKKELQVGPEPEQLASFDIKKELDVSPEPNTDGELEENVNLQAGEEPEAENMLANVAEIDVEAESVLEVEEDEADPDASVEFITQEDEAADLNENNLDVTDFSEEQAETTSDAELEFMVGDEVQNESTIEADAIETPSAAVGGDVEFVTDIPEVPTVSSLFTEEDNSEETEMTNDPIVESQTMPVEEVSQETTVDIVAQEEEFVMDTPQEEGLTENPTEDEPFKLVFEPAFPGAEKMMDLDFGSGGGDSLIIEDYVEVPTVAQVEENLKKQEKEKKRFRGRKARHQEMDGFAYSLDDLENPGPADESNDAKPEFVLNDSAKQRILAEEKRNAESIQSVPTVAALTEAVASATPVDPANALVIGQQVIHKEGKNKRTYFRLIYQ